MKKRFKKNIYIYSTIILMCIVVGAVLVFSKSSVKLQTLVVHPTEFESTVSVSGKVVAEQYANLGFDQSGRVSAIYVKVGDTVKSGAVIASIDNSDVRSNIFQKQANLEKEMANLAALKVGTRPEEIAVSQQKYDDAISALSVAMKSAYLQTEYATTNKADSLFTNGDSVNPTLNIQAQSDTEKRSLESDRLVLRDNLINWKSTLANMGTSTTSINNARLVTYNSLTAAKSFFDRLGSTVANLTPGSSGLTQVVIDEYKLTVNAGAQSVSSAASTEQTAESNWSSSKESLTLVSSGTTKEKIDAQLASVKAAQADLDSTRAQLSKTSIIAPFDGIVTKMDAKVGEIASPQVSEISIMSVGAFEIDSYVPEINIAAISLNNHANITLDAYGDEVKFGASIQAIDPAETMRDGVSTYKTKLQFDEVDDRIKSGMTANVIITTAKKSDVIVVPQGIITAKDGKKYVQLSENGKAVPHEVTTGGISSFGQIEITSGLQDNDVVILNSTN